MNNLSSQFNNAENVEEKQRRRFNRRREPNYSGAGFWYFNYPYMIGALGAGIDQRLENTDNRHELNDSGQTASVADGMSTGGTATSVGGMQ